MEKQHIPLIPESAPFSLEQRSWLNGFLAGWLGQGQEALAPAPASRPLTVLYGSQSGTAESLAKKIGRAVKSRGFAPRVLELNSLSPAELAGDGLALIVTSTWGDGEMPDNAREFWEQLANGAPRMESLRYGVLALGDTNYADTFCKAGQLIDARLTELGAQRICERIDCDTDYEGPADQWIANALAAIAPGVATAPPEAEELAEEAGYNRKNPFPAALLANRMLNEVGSSKDVRHIEFSLEGSGLTYEAGDALGVQPLNCPVFVYEILAAAGLTGDEPVEISGIGECVLHEALLRHYELRPFVTTPPQAGTAPAGLIAGLKRLAPRLYSISSSPKAHPGQVHLTVGTVRFQVDGKTRKGACSTFLSDRLALGETAGVFIQHSPHFRPPANPDAPMIMVGPGTGIAPFRAFLEEREATGAKGKNWLFFGDQHAATDYLYEEQLDAWVASGHLTRLDLAFSRDQAEKIYVQQRMLEHADLLWTWMQDGACFYVCGDASRMAKDVDDALLKIASETGGLGPEKAMEWIKQLKKEHRYERDVY